MFKKIVLLLFLFAVVVGVSYYKTTIQDDSMEAAYLTGQIEAGHEADRLQHMTDSLTDELEVKEALLADTKNILDTIRVARNDSLLGVIQSRNSELADLTPSQSTAPTQATAVKTDSTSKRHREILAYYKKRYQNLPRDLSAYERRVALSEIREESANKFKISVAKLNSIRKDNNLSY